MNNRWPREVNVGDRLLVVEGGSGVREGQIVTVLEREVFGNQQQLVAHNGGILGARICNHIERFVLYRIDDAPEQKTEEAIKDNKDEERPNKNMKFKYLDIVKSGEPKIGSWMYWYPHDLTGATNDLGIQEPWRSYINRCVFKINSELSATHYNGLSLAGTTYNYSKSNCILLRFPVQALVSMLHIHNKIITIEPNAEAKKCIKTILSFVKPKDNVLVSQVFLPLDQLEFKGLSIFCDNKTIAIYHKDILVKFDLAAEEDYARKLKLYFGEIALDNKKDYEVCVQRAFDTSSKNYATTSKQVLKDIERQLTPVKNFLKDNAAKVVKYKKGLKELKNTTLPANLSELVKRVEAEAKAEIEETECQAKTYALIQQNYKKQKDMVDFINSSKKSPGKDYELVNKLLKKGVIEKIGYEKGSLFWIYSPMTYKHLHDRSEEVFLGRIKITINEKEQLPSIKMISYSSEAVGTLHYINAATGRSYCLGSYQEIINNLLAAKRVGDLILVIKDYFSSYNADSPYASGERGRSWDIMNMEKPQVNDDSFEVWKKKNATTVAA